MSWDEFIGPCVHGRDPYTRCETCDELDGRGAKAFVEADAIVRELGETEVTRSDGEVDMCVFCGQVVGEGTGHAPHCLIARARRYTSPPAPGERR